MSVKCGNCTKSHETPEEVRSCFRSPLPKRSRPPIQKKRGGLTDPQRNLINRLLGELGRDETTLSQPVDGHDKSEASRLISSLIDEKKTLDREVKQTSQNGSSRRGPAITEDGMYRTEDGTIYKVQIAVHGSGFLYAKKLVVERGAERDAEGKIIVPAVVRFDFAQGAVYKLRPEERMTIEQAKAFGALYGTCVRCGRTLTREDSIERMMGPVCAGKI